MSARQLDDFGTGYSSLLYLRRYPIDIIQIDRVLVAGIGRSGEDEAICRSITSLAAAVGASSVGEGVETAEQYARAPLEGLPSRTGTPVVPGSSDRPARHRHGRVRQDASLHTIAAALNRTVGLHPKGVRWTAGAVARGLSSLSGTEPDGPRSRRALGDGNGSDAYPTPMERPA